jgi:hypothetical protein
MGSATVESFRFTAMPGAGTGTGHRDGRDTFAFRSLDRR